MFSLRRARPWMWSLGLLSPMGCERAAPVAQPPIVRTAPRDMAPDRVEVDVGLPDVTLDGVGPDGEGRFELRTWVSESSADVVAFVVSGGSWCGTCQWLAEEGPDALGAGVRRVDVVLGDRDNAPATVRAAARFRDAYPALRGGVVLADPEDRLRPAGGHRATMLPRILLVDPATLDIVDVVNNPSPAELEHRVARALALGDGNRIPARPRPDPLIDGLFEPHEWDLLQRTRVPSAPPPDASNTVAESPAAAALGRALFFDPGLSGSGELSCASCHQPDNALSDGRPRALGAGEGSRRTPSVALAAHARWQFWDGRADSLWSQALAPIESKAELDGSRVQVARRLLKHHRAAYRAAFPEAALPDPSDWPLEGKPGVAAYDALPPEVQNEITAVFVHAGKSIAAWERTLRVAPNRLDAYLAGDTTSLSSSERYGLHLFVRQGCMQCHWGPRLTDDAFHAVALSNPLDAHGDDDPGRADGFVELRTSEFRRDGRWSDAPEGSVDLPPQLLRHQFKTPALRGVADATHWGHAGQFDQLAGVTEAYGTPPSNARLPREPWLPTFSETAQWGLVPFLQVLSAELVGT